MALELYHHGSSVCAAKVRFALAEKGLPWTGHYVDILKGEQFEPEFLALNPKAVVPVLVHDGVVIVESTVICEYFEEIAPERPIYPRTPLARARVRVWTKAVDEELHPACSAITYAVSHRHTILRNGAGSFDEFLAAGVNEGTAARRRKWQWIQQGLEAPGVADQIRLYDAYLHKMEQSLRDANWLVGDDFSMADILALTTLDFATRLNDLPHSSELTHLSRWYDEVSARPSASA